MSKYAIAGPSKTSTKKTKMRQLLPFLLALLLSGMSFAQNADDPDTRGTSAPIIQALNTDSNDYYITIIDYIFGGGTITDPTPSLGGDLSAVISSFLLFGISLIMLYKVITYIGLTMSTGILGGQKISLAWIIIASTSSLIATIPFAGYSPSQYAITSIAKLGAGIASEAAVAGAKYMTLQGGTTPTSVRYTDPLLFSIIKSEACMTNVNSDLFNGTGHPDTKDKKIIPKYICKAVNGEHTHKSNSPPSNGCAGSEEFVMSWDLVKTVHDVIHASIPVGSFNGFCGSIKIKALNRTHSIDRDGPTRANIIKPWINPQKFDELRAKHFEAQVKALVAFTQDLSSENTNNRELYKLTGGKFAAYQVAKDNLAQSEKTIGEGYILGAGQAATDSLNEHQEELNQKAQQLHENAFDVEAETSQNYLNRSSEVQSSVSRVRAYQSKFDAALASSAAQLTNNYKNTTINHGDDWIADIEQKGFAVLGFYYMIMINLNEKIRELASITSSYSEPTFEGLADEWGAEVQGTGLLDDVSVLASMPLGNGLEYAGLEPDEYGSLPTVRNFDSVIKKTHIKKVCRKINGEITDSSFGRFTSCKREKMPGPPEEGIEAKIAELVKVVFKADTHIILQMAHLGRQLIFAGLMIMAAVVISGLATKIIGIGGFLTSTIGAAIGKTIGGFLGKVAAIGFTLSVPLIVVGVLLALWLPFVVTLEFAMSLFSLVIIYITALFVIPIWVAGMAMASSYQVWEVGHFRQGFVMVIGQLLRPTLMVSMFFFVDRIFVVLGLIMSMVVDYLIGLNTGGIISFILLPASVALIAFVGWTLTIRVAHTISMIPDKIMTGLNLGNETFGSLQDSQQIEGTLNNAMRAIGSGAQAFVASKK